MTDIERPRIVFLDAETGGLRWSDTPWEIALIERDRDGEETERLLHVADFNPASADPKALELNGFYKRHPYFAVDQHVAMNPVGSSPDKPVHHEILPERDIAARLERLTRDAITVACNPTFDVLRLTLMMARNGFAWTAHYRPVCATAYAAGKANADRRRAGLPPLPLPWRNADIGEALGVPRDRYGEIHTGLADVLYGRDLFDAVEQGVPSIL